MLKKQTPYPPLFAAKQYYSKQIDHFPISAVKITQEQPTYLRKNPGIILLYFVSDSGRIAINSRIYPVKGGMFMCLGAYHYFQLLPEAGKPMQLYQCRLDYDTFLYMAANPYYEFHQLTMSVEPLTAAFSGGMKAHVERLLEEFTALSVHHKQRGGRMEFLLCMQLVGYLQKFHKDGLWVSKHLHTDALEAQEAGEDAENTDGIESVEDSENAKSIKDAEHVENAENIWDAEQTGQEQDKRGSQRKPDSTPSC